MLEVLADVTLFGADRGGLEQPVKNGLRPSFSYAGELVACELWGEHMADLVPLDRSFRARIKLPYGDELNWQFVDGESFTLTIASQWIGEGVVVAAGGASGWLRDSKDM